MRYLLSKVSLRAAIILPFVVQMSAAASLIAWLSTRNSHQDVSDVADQLWEETSLRMVERVTEFMDSPQNLIWDTASFQDLDIANFQNSITLTRYLWHQMRSHEDLFITAVAYEDGTVVEVGTEAEDQLVIRQIEAGQTQLHTYEILGEGNKGTLLRADDFDVKGRPWYQKG